MDIKELIDRFKKSDKEDWHVGLHAASNACYLIENPGPTLSFMSLEYTNERVGAKFLYAKEYLTDYFKDRDGYYGAGFPHTIIEIWQQKVDGLFAIARLEMPTGCDRKFWVANRNNLNDAIGRIQNSKNIYFRIRDIVGDRKFCATKTESCLQQIVKALEESAKQTNHKQVYPFFEYLLECTGFIEFISKSNAVDLQTIQADSFFIHENDKIKVNKQRIPNRIMKR